MSKTVEQMENCTLQIAIRAVTIDAEGVHTSIDEKPLAEQVQMGESPARSLVAMLGPEPKPAELLAAAHPLGPRHDLAV